MIRSDSKQEILMRGGAFASLKWVIPKPTPVAQTADQSLLAASQVGRALQAAIAEFGLPEPSTKKDKTTAQAEAA
ncbi:MAG TPA: hypothetical protein VH092_21105, partial [Urbifossiella sp.]|nr:hypothetical protein [Urbifossiella sp.]